MGGAHMKYEETEISELKGRIIDDLENFLENYKVKVTLL